MKKSPGPFPPYYPGSLTLMPFFFQFFFHSHLLSGITSWSTQFSDWKISNWIALSVDCIPFYRWSLLFGVMYKVKSMDTRLTVSSTFFDPKLTLAATFCSNPRLWRHFLHSENFEIDEKSWSPACAVRDVFFFLCLTIVSHNICPGIFYYHALIV